MAHPATILVHGSGSARVEPGGLRNGTENLKAPSPPMSADSHRVLQAWIDRLALQSQNTEDTFVDSAKRLLSHETLQ